MTKALRISRSFTEIADLIAENEGQIADSFAAAFADGGCEVRLAASDECVSAEMPDPREVQLAIEMMVTTLFDVLRDTRLEPLGERIAWGVVQSFHKVAGGLEGEADHAARKLGDLVRENDGSEVANAGIEEAQTLCHGLDEAVEAMACMRDHAAQMFHAETGHPWSSPRATLTSGKRTASVIAAADFLAARRAKRIEAQAPSGPIVLFSGGQIWEDHARIWGELDAIRARIPAMVLATTAQDKGCDAIAAAWAARSGIKLVTFTLDRRLGKRAGFARNEAMMRLRPVEAVVCEGSGLQSHLARLVRDGGVPAHFIAQDASRTRHRV
ncbi:DUF2493 domain-containing protein [Novosphingobium sp. KA1]|uniref:DUF2493 domain-containing protein n=1 Tax=Novosphingobium sp. (strain KA1) TaxID=164608 RepID=UPI001A90BD3F|nr:DUF2493 domain-containing protein [Novosphingobium sp. KA1]QSR19739.1 hypothetical protein CA833_21585 [Novosphingobium sp. KA1]